MRIKNKKEIKEVEKLVKEHEKKQDLKICNICKIHIYMEDDYVRLTEYRFGQQHSEGYYHLYCYREKFLMKKKEVDSLLGKSNVAIDSFLRATK